VIAMERGGRKLKNFASKFPAWLRQVLILFIIFTLIQLCYAVPSTPASQPPAEPQPAGRVVWVQGSFMAVKPNHQERTLSRASILYVTDTLVTGTNSQAQIVFTDNTLMTFRPETKFYIADYQYHPTSQGSVGKYVMRLIEGGFRTITGLIAKRNPSDYQVNTPVATIGVRGTDYTVYLNKSNQLYVGYYSGTPCVTSVGGGLCLGSKTPYAMVPKAQAIPVPLAQPPEVFKEKLQITPARIAPSPTPTTNRNIGQTTGGNMPGNGNMNIGQTTGGNTTNTGNTVINTGSSGGNKAGTVSNFCISN